MNNQTDTYVTVVTRTVERLDLLQNKLKWLESHREAILKSPLALTEHGEGFDFDNPTREQVIEIVKLFPGDWEKSVWNDKMNYCTTHDGMDLRLWAAPLSPGCKLIEETETIPEDQIQRTRVVRRVVCPKT